MDEACTAYIADSSAKNTQSQAEDAHVAKVEARLEQTVHPENDNVIRGPWGPFTTPPRYVQYVNRKGFHNICRNFLSFSLQTMLSFLELKHFQRILKFGKLICGLSLKIIQDF